MPPVLELVMAAATDITAATVMAAATVITAATVMAAATDIAAAATVMAAATDDTVADSTILHWPPAKLCFHTGRRWELVSIKRSPMALSTAIKPDSSKMSSTN